MQLWNLHSTSMSFRIKAWQVQRHLDASEDLLLISHESADQHHSYCHKTGHQMILWGCAGQSLSELVDYERDLKSELESGRAQDPEFKSAVLKRIAPHKARAELQEIHSMLRSRQLANGKSGAKQSERSGWRGEVKNSPPLLPRPLQSFLCSAASCIILTLESRDSSMTMGWLTRSHNIP